MYKNNSRDSSKIVGCSALQLSCNLKGMKPAIGYYSYTNRCVPFKNRTSMKQQALIILGFLMIFSQLTFGQDTLCENCIEYSLKLNENKFKGSSLQFAGYDVSMILPSDFVEDSLSINYLFKTIRSHDIRGEFIFPNGQTTEINYSIIPYHNSMTVFMKTSNGWYPWDKLRIENNKLIFSYDYWYCPPATKTDLEILDLCFEYLKDSTNWHKKDDRNCDDDKIDKTWSLFCAIKVATIEKYGEYNHRGTVIQRTRFVIDELYPNHEYSHTLMDFNNDSSTKFDDIIKVLSIVKDRIKKELETSEK